MAGSVLNTWRIKRKNINSEIKELKIRLANLEKIAKECKVDLSYKNGCCFVGMTDIGVNYAGSSEDYIEHSRYRDTKEQAEYSLARNKRANGLEALVMKLQPDELGGDWYVYKYEDKWGYGTAYAYYPERVMMNEETAIKVCEMLSSGEYSLEDECNEN